MSDPKTATASATTPGAPAPVATAGRALGPISFAHISLARVCIAIFDLAGALVVGLGVFVGLPARFWVVDIGAVLVVASLVALGISQVFARDWVQRAARIGGWVTLGLGLALIAALALSFSYLTAIYGPVGLGGALICALTAALAIPYLVVLPAVQLVGLGGRDRAS